METLNKIAVSAYSGGLDSTLVLVFLKEKYGYNRVIPVCVDVGQGDEEIEIAKERIAILGYEMKFFDAKKEFAEDYIFRCIKANGNYQGYPLGTSMSRVLIATKIVQVAEEVRGEAVAHGCTGKGNDQFRMEATFKYLAPHLKAIAPIREYDLSRPEEEKLLREYGIEPRKRRGELGGDVNMWSHSIGSGQVEDLYSHYPRDYIWAVPLKEAPDKPREVVITFNNGIPVDVDGIKDPVEMILYLNKVGGENGIGRIDMFEDGMIGLKSRELYEAPAATILLTAHADLEHLTLAKDQLRLKGEIDRLWAEMVYHAGWFNPLKRNLDAFIDSTQEHVNGIIYMSLYKGTVTITKRESTTSLFAPELRSIKKGGFDQRQATGAVRMFTIPYQLFHDKKRS